MEERVLPRDNAFAHTKVRLRVLPARHIPRPHLVSRLDRALADRQFILLSAPAGYGKSTLLNLMAQSDPTRRYAWLSLDAADNDLTRFLAVLIAAMQQVQPNCGGSARQLLDRDPASPFAVGQLIATLVNDLLLTLSEPAVLILDDLHLITEPLVYLALDELLEHLPPTLHVIVATRRDPPLALGRWHVRGQLLHLTLSDLCFLSAESRMFLQTCMNLDLTLQEQERLESFTEGWPGGVRIWADALTHPIRTRGQTEGKGEVLENEDHLFDVFAHEVFDREDAFVQRFLLETSILSELTPALCAAVTGDADAGTLLRHVEKHNLFVIPIAFGPDEADRALRYHPLFARFLRHNLTRVMPLEIPILHHRAAQAYRDDARSIPHYLAAQHWDEAAAHLTTVGPSLLDQGHGPLLQTWIAALPGGIRERRPSLLALRGLCAFREHSWGAAAHFLRRAAQGFAAAGDVENYGKCLVPLSEATLVSGDAIEAHRLARTALALPLSAPDRILALMTDTAAEYRGARLKRSLTDAERVLRIAEQSPEEEVLLQCAVYLPLFITQPGALMRVQALPRAVEARNAAANPNAAIVAQGLSALVGMWQGELLPAIRQGKHALARTNPHDLAHAKFTRMLLYCLAYAHAAQGKMKRALRAFDDYFRRRGQPAVSDPLDSGMLYGWGRTSWQGGEIARARRIYARMQATDTTAEPGVLRLLLGALIDMAENRYYPAEQALHHAIIIEDQQRFAAPFGSGRLLLAHLFLSTNRPQQAARELYTVLTTETAQAVPFLILKEGAFVIPLLHFAVAEGIVAARASHLLGLLGVPSHTPSQHSNDRHTGLSTREIETLRELATGARIEEIAITLGISPTTVKTHLTHIYQKLEVTSRAKAVVRGRELHLLT